MFKRKFMEIIRFFLASLLLSMYRLLDHIVQLYPFYKQTDYLPDCRDHLRHTRNHLERQPQLHFGGDSLECEVSICLYADRNFQRIDDSLIRPALHTHTIDCSELQRQQLIALLTLKQLHSMLWLLDPI